MPCPTTPGHALPHRALPHRKILVQSIFIDFDHLSEGRLDSSRSLLGRYSQLIGICDLLDPEHHEPTMLARIAW